MKYTNYEVTARNEETGRTVTETLYCPSAEVAREDFLDCYRHATYTILSVEPEAGTLTDEEWALLAKIAREQIPGLEGRPNLEAMNSDDLDFFETAVWSLEAALAAAYRAGKEAAAKK
jgi:hypothetical protein